jgi:ankyrin repeat protein
VSVILIIAIELTLTWNKLDEIYELGSAGQMIPFVIGLVALLHTLYRFRLPIESREDKGPVKLRLLLWTAKSNHVRTAHVLLYLGFNAQKIHKDARENRGHMMPIIWATRKGHKDMVELFLRAGVDINTNDDRGTTSLLWALSWTDDRHKSIVDLLLRRGADVNLADHLGRSPLTHAIALGDELNTLGLLDHGAEPKKDGRNYHELLSSAVERGNRTTVERLLHSGSAEPLIVRVINRRYMVETLIPAAEASGRQDIVDVLRNAVAAIPGTREEVQAARSAEASNPAV